MSATWVLFFDGTNFVVGKTPTETPVSYTEESSLETVEGDDEARALRRILQAGISQGKHELAVSQ
jgi:hypothetical protein